MFVAFKPAFGRNRYLFLLAFCIRLIKVLLSDRNNLRLTSQTLILRLLLSLLFISACSLCLVSCCFVGWWSTSSLSTTEHRAYSFGSMGSWLNFRSTLIHLGASHCPKRLLWDLCPLICIIKSREFREQGRLSCRHVHSFPFRTWI